MYFLGFFWVFFKPKLNQIWASDEDETFQLLHDFCFKKCDVFVPKKQMLGTCHLPFGRVDFDFMAGNTGLFVLVGCSI